MIRERLCRAFPISRTDEDRRQFLSWLWFGFSVEKDAKREASELYLGQVAASVVLLCSLITGAGLFIFFAGPFYTWFDFTPYAGVDQFDLNLYHQAGRAGLYVYYYVKIMQPVIWTIPAACFLLFLIHVKKGRIRPFRIPTPWFLKKDGSINFSKLLFSNVLGFVLGIVLSCNSAAYLDGLTYIPGAFWLVTQHRPFWLVLYGFIMVIQGGGDLCYMYQL